MQELSDLATESKADSSTEVLERDLACLLEVGYALRSVPENDIDWWMNGQERCGVVARPRKKEVVLLRQPNVSNEYEVVAPSGEVYTLVVEPNAQPEYGIRVPRNKVTIRYSRRYSEGPNTLVGPAPPNEHKLSALLQVIRTLPSEYVALNKEFVPERVPLKVISFDNLVGLVKAYNGFRTDRNNPVERNPFSGTARFYDANFEHLFEQKPEKLGVYVDIRRGYAHGGNYIEMSLRVELPEKRIRTFLTKEISIKGIRKS